MTLTVWAPHADTVDIVLGTNGMRREAMQPSERGWWIADLDPDTDLPEGRYAFSVNGGDPRPDPRSRRQPDGVHAASQWVDLSAHPWEDRDWTGAPLKGAVIYEAHLGTLTPGGTADSAIEALDHLVDLGVTMISLLPVAAAPGAHGWGYDGVAPYAVHEAYGGAPALQRFVDAAHQRGLSVGLDVVYNHLGPSGNYLGEFGPYFTDTPPTPWGQAVNLDKEGSDEVRQYLLDNVRMWLTDFHLDALRLDAVHELHDRRATHILEEMAKVADEVAAQTGVPRHLIAESDRNDPATVAPRGTGGLGGLGLAGQWADDVHHALHVVLTGEEQGYYSDFADPAALPKVLATTPFFHDGTYSSFRQRSHGREVDPEVTPGWQYIASLQTHDQVGNRAAGDRLVHLLSPGRAAGGAALLLTSPYTPMLFMGEEWAASTPWQYFTDHAEPELATAISEGRQREFADHGWGGAVPDPQSPDTVAASTLDWSERHHGDHRAMYQWYRTLLRLRRERPGLRDAGLGTGEVHISHADGAAVGDGAHIVIRRGEVVVAVNLSPDRDLELTAGDGELLAHWGRVEVEQGRLTVSGESVAILG